MPKKINLNLDQLAQGGLQELFDMNVKKIFENIQDLNTEAKIKRKMTITLEFTPDDNRGAISMHSLVKLALAPTIGVGTTILAGVNSNGEIEANELQSSAPGQTFLDMETGELKSDIGEPLEEKQVPKVIDLQAKRAQG